MEAAASAEEPSADYYAEDRSGVLLGISIAMAALTTVILALRFYAKRFQGGGFFADDAFTVASYIVNLGMCAVGIIITKIGAVGRHVEYVERFEPAKIAGWAQGLLAFELIYFTSIALPKLAIICLYLRLFNWKGTMLVLAWILFVLVSLTSLSLVIAACFQCIPIAYWWDRTIEGGTCFDIQGFFHAQAIPGFILDLAIMALPMETIWNLNLPRVKRLALLGIFAVASFGIVASIIRAKIFFGTAAFSDETMASVDLIGWSIIETSVYIITNCLPHLRPLLSHYTPECVKRALRSCLASSFGTYGGSYGYDAYGNRATTGTGTTGKKGGTGTGTTGTGTGTGRRLSKLSGLGKSSTLGGQSRSRRSPDGVSSSHSEEDDTIELTRHNPRGGADAGLDSPEPGSPWDVGGGLEAQNSTHHPHALAPGWERGGARGKESASRVEIRSDGGEGFYRSNSGGASSAAAVASSGGLASSAGGGGGGGLGSITVTREVKLTRT